MANWDEKDLHPATLPVSERRPSLQRYNSKWRALRLCLITLFAVPTALRCATHIGPFLSGRLFDHLNDANICPQAEALYPDRHAPLWESLGKDFSQNAFTLKAAEWLGGAVRVP